MDTSCLDPDVITEKFKKSYELFAEELFEKEEEWTQPISCKLHDVFKGD